jgi:hypothetical protein
LFKCTGHTGKSLFNFILLIIAADRSSARRLIKFILERIVEGRAASQGMASFLANRARD